MGEIRVKLRDAIGATFALPTGQSHQIQLVFPRVLVLDVEDGHFNLDRSVLLPDLNSTNGTTPVLDTRRVTGLGVIFAALVHAKKNSAQGMFVSGHTDGSGSVAHNQPLSEDRAKNVSLLLRGKRDDWRKHANREDAVDDIQTVLKWQHQRAGWDCDPGDIDNKLGTATKAAIGRFQDHYNQEVEKARAAGKDSPFKKTITSDKKVGEETWGAVYDLYMDELLDLLDLQAYSALEQMQAALKPPPGMTDFVGCGEHIPFNPARRNPFAKSSDELEGPQRNPPDRRVEILFFDPGEEVDLICHPKPGKCVPAECPLYNKAPHKQTPIGIPKGLTLAEVNVKLTFVDPEGKVRPFPEGLEVEARFGDPLLRKNLVLDDALLDVELDDDEAAADPDAAPAADSNAAPAAPDPGADPDAESMEMDQEPNELVGPGGVVRFVIPRKSSSLYLRFLPGDKRFITADPKNLADTKLVTQAEAVDAVAQGRVFFALPKEFDTQDAYFKGPDGVKFDDGRFQDIDNRETQIGSRESPAELKLEIHWLHFKFEYFDRWTSSIASVPQPRTKDASGTAVPPLVMEGVTFVASADGDPIFSPAMSAWDVKVGKDTVHCLAWPFRIVNEKSRRELPDEQCMARFKADGLFVRTEGDGKSPDAERRFAVFPAGDKTPPRTPGADRLRLYDLPSNWWSAKYPMRMNDEAADKLRPFEKVATTKSALDKPYVASLDIIVLQAPTGTPGPDRNVAFDDAKLENRFTLFDNEMKVYKPDPKTGEPYFTQLKSLAKPPEGPVLHDFPPFTRLITRGPFLYDVFDARTPRGGLFKDMPIGARLARRIQGIVSNTAHTLAGRPYQAPQPNGSDPVENNLGRALGIFLRCCGHDGNVELFHIVQYLAVNFDFAPTITAELKKDHPLLADAEVLPAPPANAVNLARDCLLNVAARWSGSDGVNKDPAAFEIGSPVVARGKFSARLHRAAKTPDKNPVTGEVRLSILKKGRAFMSGSIGFWKKEDMELGDDEQFVAAHEFGHAFSHPDEYLNRDFQPSLERTNIGERGRSAGTPYGLDDKAMMNANRRIRARYFWDLLLFAAANDHFADQKVMSVKHGATATFTTTITPPDSSRVRFPVLQKTNVVVGKIGLCDLFLYVTGRDEWTAGEIDSTAKAAPYDGVVVVRVKMGWELTGTDQFESLRSVLIRAAATIRKGFNDPRTVVVRGTFDKKPVRLRVLFAPRFISHNFPKGTGADKYLKSLFPVLPKLDEPSLTQRVTDLIGKHGIHVEVRVAEGTPGVTMGAKGREAVVRQDKTKKIFFTDERFDGDVTRLFGQMVGMDDGTVNPARLKTLFDNLAPDLSNVKVEVLG